ncbi:hypothetical protein [Acidisoma sp. L85]|uniref:hypothetical protein n=1 Tax=Acidisoma sp. L85 TaxID=1641850 RepID=UPI00131C0AA9|nr:hypothetical protein [Acidisoma sp. L85]
MLRSFDDLVNWKLLPGSHEFPGPDGGTCINEAAAVAAGFSYRKIDQPDDCPPCFSRILAGYEIELNDGITDDDMRQKMLMPFVVRMAGTAAVEAVERRRADHMMVEYVRRILSFVHAADGYYDIAVQCQAVAGTSDCFDLLNSLKSESEMTAVICKLYDDFPTLFADTSTTEFSAMGVGMAINTTGWYTQWDKVIFAIACQTFGEAIALGNHATLDAEVAVERLEAAMQDA